MRFISYDTDYRKSTCGTTVPMWCSCTRLATLLGIIVVISREVSIEKVCLIVATTCLALPWFYPLWTPWGAP